MKSKLEQLIEQTAPMLSTDQASERKMDITPLDAALLGAVAGGLAPACNQNIQCWNQTQQFWVDL